MSRSMLSGRSPTDQPPRLGPRGKNLDSVSNNKNSQTARDSAINRHDDVIDADTAEVGALMDASSLAGAKKDSGFESPERSSEREIMSEADSEEESTAFESSSPSSSSSSSCHRETRLPRHFEDEGQESDDSDEAEEQSGEEDEDENEDVVKDEQGPYSDIPHCKMNFESFQLLGTGTFGRVVLCRDRETKCYNALKIMAIEDVVRLKQVQHVNNEKNILETVKHPFLVNLLWTSHDDTFLYMLFDYVCGGELFTYLRHAGNFDSATANFYTAEIVSALEYLHALAIVYRDMKPENLLLDKEGHLKITDFGFAKKLEDRTWTLCGTPEYLAPEIIQSKGHNKAVDWWALGILIYEMLIGYPPFFDDNPFGIYEKILTGVIEWPKHIDLVAKDLIRKLLVQDRTRRLGNMKRGAEDVKHHRWFKRIAWADVYQRKLQPPIVPNISHDGDTRNFEDYPDSHFVKPPPAQREDIEHFKDF